MIGALLNHRYRLDSYLGRGGMGMVYQAHDTLLDRDVAVKLVSEPGLGSQGRTRLLNEARAAARLNHPNIVTVYDAGETQLQADGPAVPYIVMELVQGESLDERRPAALDELYRVARQICAALEDAHAHGILHRDLKPENVLVTASGVAKLTDFGLARSFNARVTSQGTIVGTIYYMAPELMLGQPVDGRADLYALGVMLYELACGRLPFTADTPLGVISQHIYAPVVPPSAYRPELPAALDNLVVRLLAKDPQDRYPDARAAADALEAAEKAGAALPAEHAAENVDDLLEKLARGRLVGRQTEMDALHRLWQSAQLGQPQLALLSGEPGVGKTRLANELIVYARLSGAVTLRGGCYEYEAATPYLPFIEALRQWVRRQDDAGLQAQVGDLAPELVKLAPELAGRLGQPAANPPLSPNEERLRLFDHVARFFERAAAGRGLLLFIDDIHWADQSTLALLNYLLRHLKNTRWMGLACYREVELDRAHPFAAALVDWGRGRLATRLALGRLSQADVGQLLAALFGLQSTSTEFTEAVYRETEGNPFFVEEVIKALIEQGQIYRQDGRWQRGEITELTIPQSIKEAIGRRLDRQSAACVEMLHIAAALGKRFTYSELAAVSNGMDENRLLDGLDEAVSAQLLRSEGGETFAFTHDKIREVLYEEMNPVRRRRLHLRLGQGLEQLFQPGQGSRECSRCDSEVQTLAYHFIEGGDLEKGLEYSQQAAEKARQVFALDDARLFYEHAIECAEALERPLAAARLFEAAGDLDHQRGMYQPAVDAFQRALALLGDDPSAAAGRARIRVRLGTAYAQTGDEQGLQHLLAAIEALDPERQAEELGLAYAQLGRYHHYRAHWDQAIAMLQKALQIVEPLSGGAPVAKPHSGPPQGGASEGGASEGGASEGGAPPAIPGSETLMNIYAYLSGAYQQSGRYATSMEWAQRCIELGERTGNLMAVALGYEFLAEDHYATGKWRKGLEYGALDRALGQRLGSLSRIGWGLSAEAYSYNGLGELDKALQAAQACLEIVERSDEERLGMLARSLIVQLYLQMGQFEPAQAELEALRRRAEQGDQGQVWNWYLAAWSTQATELGRWEETLQASDLCEQKLGFRFIINDALAQIQLDRPQAVEQIRGELIEISRDHYGGSTNESPDLRLVLALIAAYQGQPGQAAALFTEAEQLYTAQETRLGLARTLYFRALFHQTAGQPAEASSYIQRALEVSRACGSVLYIEKTSGILRSLSETS